MRRRTASVAVVSGFFVIAIAIAATIAVTRASGTKKASNETTGGVNASPITILWIGDTTGPVKAYGHLQLAGVKGAADYFNSHGGIDGHHVVVNAVSDNGDPAVAASVLTQQLASATPTMVWAGSVSSDSGALIPVLARNHVFSIALTDGKAQCRSNAANIKNAYEVNLYEEDPTVINPGIATMTEWAGRYANVTALPLNSTSTGWDAVVTLNATVHKAGGSLDVADLDRAILELPPTDALRTLTHKLGYTKDNHENGLGEPGDYVVIPVGPLVNGRVQSP